MDSWLSDLHTDYCGTTGPNASDQRGGDVALDELIVGALTLEYADIVFQFILLLTRSRKKRFLLSAKVIRNIDLTERIVTQQCPGRYLPTISNFIVTRSAHKM